MSVPKLRFKEFDGYWDIYKLGSLFTKRRDKGIANVPTYSVTLNNGIVNRADLDRDTVTNLSPEEHLLVKKDDLAYNMMRMWQGALGLAPTDGIVSPAYVVLKPNDKKSNSYFFEYYFKRNRQIHNFWAYSQGLTEDRLRLYFDDFKLIKINAPIKEEQTKIASFLSAVDEKISQLTQKHELLSQYKQGMMQKLFSQQIRFKADDGSEFGEWVEWKFASCIDIFDNLRKPVSASERKVGFTPYYGANGIQSYIDGYTHEGEFILIAEDGANDLINYPVQYVNGKIWVNNHAHVVSGKQHIVDNKFLKYRLGSIDFTKYLVGGGRAKLNAGAMKEIAFLLPCLEEQTKIANFLSAIDQKIEVVAQQIEQAKQWKKGLLQQMFV